MKKLIVLLIVIIAAFKANATPPDTTINLNMFSYYIKSSTGLKVVCENPAMTVRIVSALKNYVTGIDTSKALHPHAVKFSHDIFYLPLDKEAALKALF